MATVTSAGARLILPDAGVTLTIPEGALKSGQVQEFYLAVLREDRYRPKISGEQSVTASAFRRPHHDLKLQSPFNLTCWCPYCDFNHLPPCATDNQTLLSPILLCGPSGLAFKKPAILSFQHCAALKQGLWNLSVHYSDSAPEDLPNWQVITRHPSFRPGAALPRVDAFRTC